ncbi:hypothetical protein MML48_1g12197 [Holotrichia oblita]|uniref:Uncharacterized protein n=1 Tax=Holotrichia oblita TaxID=644536 RepID=A0ACB9TVV6_HOLOL|nr:hypothetical protein MML48_1g12197 [Holotrichia oblita]
MKEHKNKRKLWILGTWNIRSIQGKEIEIIDEFEKNGLAILVITERKKKGKGEMVLKNGYMLIYSGVEKNQRAKAGVACIIHKTLSNRIKTWEAINERLLKIEPGDSRTELRTIISVYGPDENETIDKKDGFWEQLTETTENSRGAMYVCGDFNGRVGKQDHIYKTMLGKHGEETRNNNGIRLLDYCQLNNLIITNSFYQHKNIHKYTRVQQSRNEKSIIDYILVQKERRQEVMDVKIRRGAEIYSDHYLLTAKIKGNTIKRKRKIKSEHISIRTYKLREKDVALTYRNITEQKLQEAYDNIEKTKLNEAWNIFKNITIESAIDVCGIFNRKSQNKQTAWWNDEIKEEVKKKKLQWKIYLNDSTSTQYGKYKHNENRKRRRHIKDANNVVLTNELDIMNRWREYFQGLLGGNTIIAPSMVRKKQLNEDNNEVITMEELEVVIKMLKNGKSPGEVKITSEMIKGLGETGRRCRLEIINKAWIKEEILDEWSTALLIPIHFAEPQSGFRPGRSAQDHIFTIKQILEKEGSKQRRPT